VQSSVTQPIPRCLCDFATRDDERVIHENTLADLGIENVMPKHHGHLIVDFGDDGTNELQVWFISEHLVDVPLVRADAPASEKEVPKSKSAGVR
jgi:hypothetical protein